MADLFQVNYKGTRKNFKDVLTSFQLLERSYAPKAKPPVQCQ